MVFDGFGGIGVWLSMGTLSRLNMLGFSHAMHVHYANYYRIVMSWGGLCWLPKFTRL